MFPGRIVRLKQHRRHTGQHLGARPEAILYRRHSRGDNRAVPMGYTRPPGSQADDAEGEQALAGARPQADGARRITVAECGVTDRAASGLPNSLITHDTVMVVSCSFNARVVRVHTKFFAVMENGTNVNVSSAAS